MTAAEGTAPASDGWVATEIEKGRLIVRVGGLWEISEAVRLDCEMRGITPGVHGALRLDMRELERLDTAGAWVLQRAAKRLASEGIEVEFSGAKPEHAALLDQVRRYAHPVRLAPQPASPAIEVVERVGKAALDLAVEAREVLGFLGLVVLALLRTLARPVRLRLVPTICHLERAGLNALPIVGMSSFLIGIVIAHQGVVQLRAFGAEAFAVNLVALSVLRETGVLLTAIIVAGRSGSAFTAEIGTMKLNEEVDAMRTIGLDPVELLVIPRVLAMIAALPLLAFFADLMGLLGGAVMLALELGLSPAEFIVRLDTAIEAWSFGVGLIKAPFFAFIIGLGGCYMGFRVAGSAESVGRLTTLSVVHSIFLVIVLDAVFSVFFSAVGI